MPEDQVAADGLPATPERGTAQGLYTAIYRRPMACRHYVAALPALPRAWRISALPGPQPMVAADAGC